MNLWDGFTISGNQDQLIIIVEGPDGKQGLIIDNPRIGSLSFHNNTVPVHTIGGAVQHIRGGPTEVEFSILGYNPESTNNEEILKKFDPVLQKSVLELLSAINKKLNTRDDK